MKFKKNFLFHIEKTFLKLLGRNVIVKGECIRCGKCCERMFLSIGNKRIADDDEFINLKEAFPEYGIFYIKESSPSGFLVFGCSMLLENNQCKSYKTRPAICRMYPYAESFKTVHLLPSGCGFKVIPLKTFNEFLNEEENRLGK